MGSKKNRADNGVMGLRERREEGIWVELSEEREGRRGWSEERDGVSWSKEIGERIRV